MTIRKEESGQGEWTLFLSGRMDSSTSEVFREAAAEIPADAVRLTLDFRDLVYISSAGLRELMICRRRFPDGRLRIRNVGERVMETIEMVGFEDLLPIDRTDRELPTYLHLSLRDLAARLAREAGEAEALRSAEDTYTWEDVERGSQIIAEDLRRQGVGPGAHVGICGNNSINWVLTFFAVQKLDALAMLINPALSGEETGRVCALGDVDCLCLGNVRAGEEGGRLEETIRRAAGGRVRTFYSFHSRLDLRGRFGEYEALKGKFEQTAEPDDPRVVIFTSGSTGRPKGVVLSSYNLLNAAAVQAEMQGMSRADRELLMVPLFHILGLAVCLLPCALTLTPLYIPADHHSDTLLRALREERFTLLHAVPTMLLALTGNPAYDPALTSALRCTILAGARTDEKALRGLRRLMPGNHFMIAYGLSEMAPVTQTLYEDSEEHILHTVGRQVRNIRIRILNRETGGGCAPGEQGEILVQGFNLMAGYYRLPMAEQAIDGDGWLHTGDMGYLDEDGYLTLTGRYKELIIRGGENIMPAEVEAAVAGLPAVREVRVVGAKSEFYGEEAVACVSLAPGASWDEESAKKELSKRLARYKIPSRFLIYDSLPKLASGKVDSVKLRQDANAPKPQLT